MARKISPQQRQVSRKKWAGTFAKGGKSGTTTRTVTSVEEKGVEGFMKWLKLNAKAVLTHLIRSYLTYGQTEQESVNMTANNILQVFDGHM